MRVIVWRRGERREYDGITGVGIDHSRQDLVLVAGESAPLEISEWTRLEIDREPLAVEADHRNTSRHRRAIALDEWTRLAFHPLKSRTACQARPRARRACGYGNLLRAARILSITSSSVESAISLKARRPSLRIGMRRLPDISNIPP